MTMTKETSLDHLKNKKIKGSKASVKEDMRTVSSILSNQTRTIATAVIAVVWLFLVGKDMPELAHLPTKKELFLTAGFAFSALIADYIQYICAYLDSSNILKKAKKTKDYTYSNKSLFYKIRIRAFFIKQILVFTSVGLLAFFVVTSF
jgi:hypothetical protein